MPTYTTCISVFVSCVYYCGRFPAIGPVIFGGIERVSGLT